jgi:hypothetical protein
MRFFASLRMTRSEGLAMTRDAMSTGLFFFLTKFVSQSTLNAVW